MVLHYATTENNKEPVTITNITVRDYKDIQSYSFNRIEYKDEKEILSEFGNFMRKNAGTLVVGWNLKNAIYGIQQLMRRWKALAIESEFPVQMNDVIDLDEVLGITYGRNYIQHPKLKSLADLNEITTLGHIEGRLEPQLYYDGAYKKIEISTERKVSMVAEIMSLAFEEKLKTNIPIML